MSIIIHFRLIGLLLVSIAVRTGCKTADEAHTGQMASVEISGHSEREIERATATAFRANGFTQTEGLVFEKEGSSWETMNYGGWSTDRVWVRVRANVSPDGNDLFTLACDAFVVQGHGQRGTENEHKFLFAKRSECKQILDQIKASLDEHPAPTD